MQSTLVFGLLAVAALASAAELGIETVFTPETCVRKTQKGDKISVHYTGKLESGVQFDSSVNRGPFEFPLGGGRVIKGWDQGLVDMCIGEKRVLTIPSELGYGARGSGSGKVPPHATMIFDVELLAINGKKTFEKEDL
eukprot:m.37205 g.37205  ORF g.37205 m.37205 type:complete len:138 (-) comp44949_c0_seq1:76-489(-)